VEDLALVTASGSSGRQSMLMDAATYEKHKDEAHHHRHSDKRTMAYLNEFYRVRAELANRTFDFITRHNLKAQFDEEENGVASGQTASKEN
jgi:ferredoxin-NADP reductase